MATQINNSFTEFEFNDAEAEVAQTFHHLHKALFMNLRAQYANDTLNLRVSSPAEMNDFFLKKAQNDGAMMVLSYLLDLEPSNTAVEATDSTTQS